MEAWDDEYDGESSEETSWSSSSPEKQSSLHSMEDSQSQSQSESENGSDGESSSKSSWSGTPEERESEKPTSLQTTTEDSENDGESPRTRKSNWNCTPDKQLSLHANSPIVKEKHTPKSKTPRPPTSVRKEKTAVNETQNDLEKEVRRKRKRKHRPVTICLNNCRYDIVRSVAESYGLKVIQDSDNWNIYWTDFSVSLDRAMDLKRFQVVNHFPGMNEICRKDLLARNLNRMKKLFHKEYDIFPRTWSLPADLGDLQMFHATHRNRTYICKPEMGCQGRGIFLIRNIRDLNPFGKIICQLYIQKPFLIDDLKFDLRIYVLITSCDPLRIYFYNEGLARFATAKYKLPSNHNTENSYMHLTNYAVNKFSRDFVPDDAENGSKRKYTSVLKWLKDRNYDIRLIEAQIEDVIIKTIITAQPILKHNYKTCFPTHDVCSACFEILGFDIILDMNLKPWVLEVNHSPSFHTDSTIDREIKENLLRDTFAMFNLKLLDRRKILGEDRKRVIQRLQQDSKKDSQTDLEPPKTSSRKEKKVNWELEPAGGYRLIYPSETSSMYDKFFNQNLGSIYQGTAASQARVNLIKSQIEEHNLKKLDEEKKRMVATTGLKDKLLKEKESVTFEKDKKLQNFNKMKFPLVTNVIGSSFKPHHIVAEEELDRLKGMMQRGLMIRNMGIEVYIFRLLTDMGTMKQKDEKVFRRLHGMKNSNSTQLHMTRNAPSETNLKPDVNNNVVAPMPSPLASLCSSAIMSEQVSQTNTPRGTHTISSSTNQIIINEMPPVNRMTRDDVKKSLDSYNISLHCTNSDLNRPQPGAKTYRYNPYGPRTANIFKENSYSGPSIKNLSLGGSETPTFFNFPSPMRVQQMKAFPSNENLQFSPGMSPKAKRVISEGHRSLATKRSQLTAESYNSGYAINATTTRVMNSPDGTNANSADLFTANSIGDQLKTKRPGAGMNKIQLQSVPQQRQAVSATASPAQWSVERGYYYKHIPAGYNNNLISSLRAPYLASEARQNFNTSAFGGEGYNHYVKSSGNVETGRPTSGRVGDDKTVSAFGIETAGIVLPRNIKSKRSSTILNQIRPKTPVPPPDAPGPMRVTQMFFDSKGIVQPRKPGSATHVKSARESYDLLSAEILQARNIKTARSVESERIPFTMPQSGRRAPKTSSDSRIFSNSNSATENMKLLQDGHRFSTPPKVGN